MTIQELLESERSDLAKLRRLRELHGGNNETLRLLAELSDEKSERLISLNELLHYNDATRQTGGVKGEESNGHANGSERVSENGDKP